MKKKYVLKNKKRFCTILVILAVLFTSIGFAANAYAYREPKYAPVLIKSGDSLWNVAARYSNGSDIREMIFRIKQANSMTTSMVYEGQIIRVPVE